MTRIVIPILIVTGSFALFFAFRSSRRPSEEKPSFIRRLWRGVVAVWDFITNFG